MTLDRCLPATEDNLHFHSPPINRARPLTRSRPEIDARNLFEENLDTIRSIVRRTARQRKLTNEDREEFESYVYLKFLENDCRIFRLFEGRSGLKTYLSIVVRRLLLDFFISKRGKWRPSAAAKKLGAVAVQLDELMNRNRLSFDEAAKTLLTNHHVQLDRERLFQIAEQIPKVSRPRVTSSCTLRNDLLSTYYGADRLVRQTERKELALRAKAAFITALGHLRQEDYRVLKMRFRDGLTVGQIANALHRETKPLYRVINRSLRFIRARLQKEGLALQELKEVVNCGHLSFLDALESEALRCLPNGSVTRAGSRFF